MRNILIHGLGQNNGIDTICPSLYEITNNTLVNYKSLYDVFSNFCNNQEEKVNLCGLSLGGILSLDFAKEYPKKVNSIILIGTPCKIPKVFFKVQNLIFKMMPKRTFEKMGCSKREFITLVNSMSNLNIAKDLNKIKCKSLILCGAKDNVNMKSAKLLNNIIKTSEFKIIDLSRNYLLATSKL